MPGPSSYFDEALNRFYHVVDTVISRADRYASGFMPAPGLLAASSVFQGEPASSLSSGNHWGPTFTDILSGQLPPVFEVPSHLHPSSSIWNPGADTHDMDEAEQEVSSTFHPVTSGGLDPRILRILHSNRDLAVLVSFMNTCNAAKVDISFFTGQNASVASFSSLFALSKGQFDNVDADAIQQALNPHVGRYANLHEALRIIQHPLALACAVVLYGQMIRTTTLDLFHPHDILPWLFCSIPIVTSRTLIVREGEDLLGNESVRHYTPSFIYEPSTADVPSMVASIISSVRTLLPCKATSEFLVNLDKIVVSGFESVILTKVPNGLHLPHVPYFATPADDLAAPIDPSTKVINVHTLVSRYLAQLHAYAVNKDCDYSLLEVSVDSMPLQDDNLCILNSFLFLHSIQNFKVPGRSFSPQAAAHVIRTVKANILSLFPIEEFRAGNFLRNITACVSAMSDPHIKSLLGPMRRGRTVIGFLQHVSKPSAPAYPMIMISETGELSSSYPDLSYSTDIVPEEEYILAYHRGHVFVTSMSRYLFMTSQRAGIRQSVYDYERELISPPEEFILQSIDNDRKMGRNMIARLKRKREHPEDLSMKEVRENAIYDQAQHLNIFSCDLETMQCPFCNVQEAACVSLRWGLGADQSITFVGQQCLSNRPAVPKNGCLEQFFAFLKERFGFVKGPLEFGDATVRRAIGLFNGANFDNFFFFTYMSFMNMSYEVVPMDNAIITLTWGNFVFYDFAKLYPGTSLESLYTTFKPALTNLGIEECPVGKWQCFPYGVIGIYDEIEIDLLTSVADWGGKRCKEFPSLSLVDANIAWWRANIGTHYTTQALKDYCLSDVDLLFLCQMADFKKVATGYINGRSYSLTTCFTVASRSLTLWRSAFAEKSMHISSPSFRTMTSVTYADGTQVSLQEALRLSYQGGLVQRYYDRMIPPALEPKVKEYEERTGDLFTIHCFDFNSKYPHVMQSNPMPIKHVGEKVFNPPVTLTIEDECLDFYLQDHALYHCSVQYPSNTCGIPAKFRGSTLMPNSIPAKYYDPNARMKERITFIWGRELREALQNGASITVHSCQIFLTDSIFADFINYCYTQRQQTDDPVLKLFWKLMMNSLYGKFAQDLKPENHIVYSLNEITHHDRLSSIRRMPDTFDGAPRYLISVIPSGKAHIGCHVWWSSYITSCARADLMTAARKFRKCKSVLGDPADVYYHDTDSLYAPKLDMSDPYTKAFCEANMDKKRLGALKDETPEGIFNAFILGKKLLTYVLRTPVVQALLRQDAFEFAQDHPEIWKITAKGAHKKSMDPLDLMRVSTNVISSFPTTFPLRFVKSYLNGITRVENAQRTIRSHDTSRLPPHPETGYCAPLASPFFE